MRIIEVRLWRGPRARRAAVARTILEALPAWFGIGGAREAYIERAARGPTFVAEANGATLGFLTLLRHTAAAWEIAVMAVLPEQHRRGVGRALLRTAEAHARTHGARYLTVKTLAPAARDRNYARTRAFYRAMGFEPIETFPTLWGEGNPCLLKVKRIGSTRSVAPPATIRDRRNPHTARGEDVVRAA